jgi:hypothetical protein
VFTRATLLYAAETEDDDANEEETEDTAGDDDFVGGAEGVEFLCGGLDAAGAVFAVEGEGFCCAGGLLVGG